MLADEKWIQKCISLVESGYIAVSPEIRNSNFISDNEPFAVAWAQIKKPSGQKSRGLPGL
jgi:hypothetical protein